MSAPSCLYDAGDNAGSPDCDENDEDHEDLVMKALNTELTIAMLQPFVFAGVWIFVCTQMLEEDDIPQWVQLAPMALLILRGMFVEASLVRVDDWDGGVPVASGHRNADDWDGGVLVASGHRNADDWA